jgi:hypothetical protein
MDDPTFDPRATDPDFETSRRRLLGGLAGGTLAGVLGWRETAADRKRQDKHDNKSQQRRRDQGGDTRRRDGKSKAEGESKREGSASTLGAGESKQGGNSPALKVLTRNLYLGADLAPVFRAGSPRELVAAVGQLFAMVQATNFPERAKALADEIVSIDAHIVGLQEVTRWRSGPADSVPLNAETDEYNFLAILLGELTARGKSYDAVVTVQNADVEAPGLTATGLKDFRITDHDAILVRTDLPKNVFSVDDAESDNFDDSRTISLAGTNINILRGWTKVDVRLHGETIRVVNTHLEPDDPEIQEKQRAELVDNPLNTDLPTVLLGDLNSPAPDGSTYKQLLDAGFVDAWTTTRGNDPGFTWGHDADLRNPEPTLKERIDFVLTRGGITASSANRVGHEPEDRTPSGLWPSDHAGVWAVLRLKDA